jgi:hypothetical protein
VQTRRNVFSPEQVSDLQQAYQSVCAELKGRPQWERVLGKERISEIAAGALVCAASELAITQSSLVDIALRAVQVQYVRTVR